MKPKIEFHILTLFPEVFEGIKTSIIGRALKEGRISLTTHQLRDWSINKHNQVDDTPYGGGAGMVIRIEPLYNAWKEIVGRKKFKTILLSAKGDVFKQTDAERLSTEKRILFVCGHYEGVDQRFIDQCVDEEVSIGEYVLTGGELPAAVMLDAIARNVQGVLGKQASVEEESYSKKLGRKKEYPHYTKPAEFNGWCVPEVLMSGNHAKIEAWRKSKLK